MAKGKKENTNSAAPETLEQALEIIAEQSAVIGELSAHIAKLEAKPVSKKPSVALGVHVYVINSGAQINGVSYTAAELAENKEVCEQIVSIEGQTILTMEE